jgi:hypothetical protein
MGLRVGSLWNPPLNRDQANDQEETEIVVQEFPEEPTSEPVAETIGLETPEHREPELFQEIATLEIATLEIATLEIATQKEITQAAIAPADPLPLVPTSPAPSPQEKIPPVLRPHLPPKIQWHP